VTATEPVDVTDFEDTGAILQEARPFLINLTAKVKAVAEDR
jgi:hypothetical protein